jgi:hypothetical protein
MQPFTTALYFGGKAAPMSNKKIIRPVNARQSDFVSNREKSSGILQLLFYDYR